jgi:RNA polymerase sigma-70 factor (ECF subfamily)
MEDKLLIWKFKRGSTDALCRIYDKYKDHLLKISAALVNDKSGAEDVVHDVVIMLAQSADSIKLTGNLKSFLATCVANRSRNVNNRERLRTACDLDQAEMVISKSPRPEQWIIDSEEFDRLNNALSQLPYEQREVITLHLHGAMKFKAIAKLQQTSINTAQSRYRYGIEKLRSLLDCEAKK